MTISRRNKIGTFVGGTVLALTAVLAASCSDDNNNGNNGSSSSSSGGSSGASSSGSSSSGSGSSSGGSSSGSSSGSTVGVAKTPIQHVILIVGENRTFDHVFGMYTPKTAGQTVSNLLSKGIVTASGAPGPNAALATQYQATDTTTYSNSPTKGAAYATLPPMMTGGAPTNPDFASGTQASEVEPALPSTYYPYLAEGGTGLASGVIDTRFKNASSLYNGPVNIDNAVGSGAYNDYASSPVHRFFQMWQQTDCNISAATAANPTGCQNDLFPWVEVSIGAGSNGAAPPAGFSNTSTGEGSTSMQYMDVTQGDAPYFNSLAQQYTMSDNFHQSVMGGTGANHIMIGFGAPIYYANSDGSPGTPPSGEIENPNPQSGTNDYYIEDGYGSSTTGSTNGGSYVNCSDNTQPGVAPILSYLNSLPYKPYNSGNCQTGAYYLVNNYNPGYLGTGVAAPISSSPFTIPPTQQNNIGLLLSKANVSWAYYGEGFDGGAEDGEAGTFCNICDPFLYSQQIMTNPTLRANNQDIGDLYAALNDNTLPAVSIVKPDGLLDGHPASSKLELFEGFCQKIITELQANPTLWANTAVMITWDEGGGYYDSGYIQPIDFFGDGTRIPLIVVSKYSTGGIINHSYGDHVSFDKFVEANWQLGATISTYSRDNLPNPTQAAGSYAPSNSPALDDLMDLFQFPST